MAISSLTTDLLHEFKEERDMINEQLALLEPMSHAIHRRGVQRLISSGALLFAEILCYILFAGGIALVIFSNKVYPLTVLTQVFYDPQYRDGIGLVNVSWLNITMYALICLCALLFLIVGRMASRIRRKNRALHLVSRDLKLIAGQHLKRKAAISAIEQRHMDMPDFRSALSVNDIPNPGYGD